MTTVAGRYFDENGHPINSLGERVCGFDRGFGLTICLLPAGYRTPSLGEGGCYIHPVSTLTNIAAEEGITLIDPEMRSIWDTDTVAGGDIAEENINDHQVQLPSPVATPLIPELNMLSKSPSQVVPNPKSFSHNIRSPRLRELVEHEESTGDLDDMDSLVALLRGTIAFQCSFLGVSLNFDEDGVPIVDADSMIALDISSKTEHQLFINVSRLTEIIKRKYEVTVLSQSLFTHERVTSYVGEITSTIDAILRDTCESCGVEHNMRSRTLEALVKVGDI